MAKITYNNTKNTILLTHFLSSIANIIFTFLIIKNVILAQSQKLQKIYILNSKIWLLFASQIFITHNSS